MSTKASDKLFEGEMNPDKEAMALVKRRRFCKILREGKRICRLGEHERFAVIELCEMIEKATDRMERELKASQSC